MMHAMGAKDMIKDAFTRHRSVLENSEGAVISEAARAAEILKGALAGGKKVFACGNGGSAADAEHFIGELLCRYKEARKPLPAISLVSPISTLTAIANDYSYDDVFARQIEALGEEGDVLVALSTSGTSKNILSALRAAKKAHLQTILLTGEKGAMTKADVTIAIPSNETARIQEMHELIYHAWCEFLDA